MQALCLAALLGSAPGARAQLLDQVLNLGFAGVAAEPGVTVASRLRPDYDPLGVRVGVALIRSELSAAVGYDDNVTGTRRARGSTLALTRARLQAGTEQSDRAAAASFTLDDVRYLDQPRQSFTNWTAALGGSLDLGRDRLILGYSHGNLNQTPRDLDTPALDRAIAYRQDSARGMVVVNLNRLSLRPELVVSRFDFDDGSVAGAPYRQRFRNRVVVTPSATAAYELAPRRNAVVVVRNQTAHYTTPTPGLPKRDYNDTTVLTGVDFDSGGVWRFRVLAGYEVRQFSSAAFKTIQAPVIEGTVIYTPTGLTTLTGTLTRRIQDSADETTVGYTETAARLSVDHEYLRNVLFKAQGGVSLIDQRQRGGQQTLYTAGAGITWLLDRNLRAAATYDFTSRQSNAADTSRVTQGVRLGGGYSESRTLLQLSLGL